MAKEDPDDFESFEEEIEDEDEQDAPPVYEAPAPTPSGGPTYIRGPGGKLIVSSD